MKVDYDVIIIGAGPAGSSCAKHLVNNGIKTLVVEEKRLPRFKCCAGLYSDRSIELIEKYFGAFPKSIWCKNDKLQVAISKRPPKFFPVQHLNYYNLNRSEMDHWLVNQSNADINSHCMFTGFTIEDDLITVKCKKNNKYLYYKCKYLVGADGSQSRIRKKIDKNYNKDNSGIVYQVVYKGNFKEISDKYYYTIVNKEYSEYFASFMIKDDLLYLTTDADKNNKHFNKLFDLITKNYNVKIEEVRKEGTYTDIYKEECLYFGINNIFLIGEAAGLISAFSEGIPSALVSGKTLAESIIKGNDILKTYKNKIQTEINFINKAFKEMRIY